MVSGQWPVVGGLGPFGFGGGPGVGGFGGDDFGEVEAVHAGPGVGAVDEFGVVAHEFLVGAEDAFEGALDAKFADEGAGVDAGDAGDVVARAR